MLLRKITMNRWHRGDPLYDKPENVGLDTISRDLKSTDNMLSFWNFDDDEGFEDAVVAFASTMERIDRLHFLLVEEQALDKREVRWVYSAGDTKFHEYNDRHVDVGALDYGNLRGLLDVVVECVKCDAPPKIRLVDRQTLKKLLKEAIECGKIKIEELNEKMSGELRK